MCTRQALYTNTSVQVNGQYITWFDVQAGVHQGSVLSLLLFIIVMEALSRHFQTDCPQELLYADDLVIIAERLGRFLESFCVWKTNIEPKGLHVNIGKTKITVSARNAPKPVEVSKFQMFMIKNI